MCMTAEQEIMSTATTDNEIIARREKDRIRSTLRLSRGETRSYSVIKTVPINRRPPVLSHVSVIAVLIRKPTQNAMPKNSRGTRCVGTALVHSAEFLGQSDKH